MDESCLYFSPTRNFTSNRTWSPKMAPIINRAIAKPSSVPTSSDFVDYFAARWARIFCSDEEEKKQVERNDISSIISISTYSNRKRKNAQQLTTVETSCPLKRKQSNAI